MNTKIVKMLNNTQPRTTIFINPTRGNKKNDDEIVQSSHNIGACRNKVIKKKKKKTVQFCAHTKLHNRKWNNECNLHIKFTLSSSHLFQPYV